MKSIILAITLVLVGFSSSFADIGDRVKYKGHYYTISYEGSNYAVLEDSNGKVIVVEYRTK